MVSGLSCLTELGWTATSDLMDEIKVKIKGCVCVSLVSRGVSACHSFHVARAHTL